MPEVIIAFESSCDDTAIALISLEGDIIWEKTFSQDDLHSDYGGVVPELASRNHLMAFQVLNNNLRENKIFSDNRIAAVSCTAGPGLIGGLISGVMMAKGLAQALNIPIIAVNHLEGHLLSPKITNKDFTYPFLSLLISGGHCEIIMAEDFADYQIWGRSVDDAAGEAFDKVARQLGLGYPGGKKIEEYALKGNSGRFVFPIAKLKDAINFSFSGLKTAITHQIRTLGEVTQQDKYDIAASLQLTIAKTIKANLEKAIKLFKSKNGKRLAVCGGVAANKIIRGMIEDLCDRYDLDYYAPPLSYCTDNAVMIGIAALEHYKKGKFSSMDFAPRSSWPVNMPN